MAQGHEKVEKAEPGKAPEGVQSPSAPGSNGLLGLQRMGGNQATLALLRRAQPKLEVGSVDDPLEREADAVAQRVVHALRAGRLPEPEAASAAVGQPISRLHRRAEIGAEGGAVDRGTEEAIAGRRGSGRPMAPETRSRFESAFGGADFSGVRLHADAESSDLNRRVSAKAFTVGSDIFFRDGLPNASSAAGQDLLAHELTHTIQQSGGRAGRRFATDLPAAGTPTSTPVPPHIQRLVDAKSFKKMTDQGLFIKRGKALKAIDGWLGQYQSLSMKLKDDKALKQREDLLFKMQWSAQQWIDDHEIEVDDSDPLTGKVLGRDKKVDQIVTNKSRKDTGAKAGLENNKGFLQDPNRKKRMSGMVDFLGKVTAELKMVQDELKNTHNVKDDDLVTKIDQIDQREAGNEKGAWKKLRAKYDGSASSVFNHLATLINLAVPREGDQASLEVEFRFPIGKGVGFVGGRILTEAEREGGVTLGSEVVVTGGAEIGSLAEAKGELGGFLESHAKDAKQATTLISYSLYRKWRESYVLPDGAANAIWGGRSGAFGYFKAERWSNKVEKEVFEDEEAYVQHGLLAGVGGKVGKKVNGVGLSMEGKLAYGYGTRWDKESIEKVKGKGNLGGANTRDKSAKLSNAQTKLGQTIQFWSMDGSITTGPVTAGLSAKAQRLGGKIGDGKWSGDASISGSVSVPMVGNGVTSIPLRYIGPAIASLESGFQRRLNAERAKAAKDTEGKKAKDVGTALDALEGMVPMIAAAKDLGPKDSIDFSSLDDTVGLSTSVAYSFELFYDFGEKACGLQIRYEKGMDYSVPHFLKVSAKRSQRLLKLSWKEGKFQKEEVI